MKNSFKLFIYTIVVICLTLTSAYAAGIISAKDISFTREGNENITNLEDAINDLYNKADELKNEEVVEEYLTDFSASSYLCSSCGGIAKVPSISKQENSITVNMNHGNSQGVVYLDYNDFSQYSSLYISFSGLVQSFDIGMLQSGISNRYEKTNNLKNYDYTSSSRQIDGDLSIKLNDINENSILYFSFTNAGSFIISVKGIK